VSRLIVATQRIDPSHPALAATVPKLAALAARVDELVVLCDDAVPGALPPEVRVHAFGAGSQAERGARFVSALVAEERRRPAALLAHMIPRYALLAASVVRPLRRPLGLWYTHWNATRELRAATRVVTHVLTAEPESFPLATPKLHAIGHGVDVGRFDRPRDAPAGALRVVALGRTSPMKRYPLLVDAVRRVREAGTDVRLAIHGPSLTREERDERARVAAEIDRLGLGDVVVLGEPVAWERVPELLAAADVLANLAEAADKIVYEAAAARTLPLASAPAFARLLPEQLRFPPCDATALAARLAGVAALTASDRAALGDELRRRVEASHSVDSWADAVVRTLVLPARAPV
jgi:glycosyltransferase involved in cell wall biosynthesis